MAEPTQNLPPVYSPGTARGKWMVLLVALAIAIPLVIPYQYEYITGAIAKVHSADELMGLQLRRTLWGLLGTVFAEFGLWYAVYAIFRFGRDTQGANRYPPPGYQMPFTNQVVEGAQARLRGRTYVFTSALVAVVAIALLAFAVWNYLDARALAAQLGLLR